jgi:hypothetical protein
MNTMKIVILGVATCLCAAATASADVQVTMHGGRVSLVAKDATVRQILTEWARVGQTKIVNVERLPGGPVTLELDNVTESQALDILLRSLSGYIAAPRAVDETNLSHFDRIIIMPTLAAARPATATPPPPVFQQAPQFQPLQPAEDDAEESRPQPNGAVANPPRGPVFNTFPQPQVVNPQGAPAQQPGVQMAPQNNPSMPASSSTPTAPYGGVSVPGMVAPAPPTVPGQAPNSVTPVKRPGGQ